MYIHTYIYTYIHTVQENQASIRTAMGFVIGMSFVVFTKKVLNHFQGVDSTDINPANLKKMILILFVMTLHSLSEGIGIGWAAHMHTYSACTYIVYCVCFCIHLYMHERWYGTTTG